MEFNSEFAFLMGTILLETFIFGISGYFSNYIEKGEKLNPFKVLVTLIYSTVIGIILYMSGTVDMTTLGAFINDPSVIITPAWQLYAGFYGFLMYLANKYVDPIVSKTSFYQTLASYFSTGFTVKPTFPTGISPFTVTLDMEVSPHYGDNEVNEFFIDWMDGDIGMVGSFKEGFASVSHTYFFEKTPKYTGHTFYPMFITKNKKGVIKEYNTDYTGRCCAVTVSAKEE
jgi:hypothetical protein